MSSSTRRALRRQAAAINVTPLVDVLLILLVLLMISMPLQVKRLPVDLPRTALGGMPTPIQSLPLALTAEGGVLLGGTELPLEDALPKISATTTVELSIAKTVQYDRIAQVITAIQERGPKEIVLVTH